MAARLDVDREQVRMLVLSVGVREAARQMGLNEATVQAWSARLGWLEHVTSPVEIVKPASMVAATTATKSPADALESVLRQRKDNTRLGLSRYVERMSQRAAEGAELKHAQDLKAVAAIAGTVWPEQSGSVTVNIVAVRFE